MTAYLLPIPVLLCFPLPLYYLYIHTPYEGLTPANYRVRGSRYDCTPIHPPVLLCFPLPLYYLYVHTPYEGFTPANNRVRGSQYDCTPIHPTCPPVSPLTPIPVHIPLMRVPHQPITRGEEVGMTVHLYTPHVLLCLPYTTCTYTPYGGPTLANHRVRGSWYDCIPTHPTCPPVSPLYYLYLYPLWGSHTSQSQGERKLV